MRATVMVSGRHEYSSMLLVRSVRWKFGIQSDEVSTMKPWVFCLNLVNFLCYFKSFVFLILPQLFHKCGNQLFGFSRPY